MPIDRRRRRERQCERACSTIDHLRDARRERIELADERLEFLWVCYDLLDAIDAYNSDVTSTPRSGDDEAEGAPKRPRSLPFS